MRLAAFFSLLICVGSAHAVEPSAEKIFQEAINYTVIIRKRVDIPFIEDEAGVWMGAGFVIDRSRGWILTNAHVAGHSPGNTVVETFDGTRLIGSTLYVDPFLDLAILEADLNQVSGVSEASLSCDYEPGTGHPVGAFGHPEELAFTGTRGIVSGFLPDWDGDWIQTDAPINAGNSGGPLISLRTGEVIGVNTQGLVGEGVESTNFAIPARNVCRIVELIMEGKNPLPPRIDATFFSSDGRSTLTVARVLKDTNSPALQPGDTIIGVGGESLDPATYGEMIHRARGTLPDLRLTVRRGDETITLEQQTAAWPAPIQRIGVLVSGVLFALSNHPDIALLKSPPSIMVHHVASGSEGEMAGFYPYQHVVRVNGIDVNSLEHLSRVLAEGAGEWTATFELFGFVEGASRFMQDIRADLLVDKPIIVSFGSGEEM